MLRTRNWTVNKHIRSRNVYCSRHIRRREPQLVWSQTGHVQRNLGWQKLRRYGLRLRMRRSCGLSKTAYKTRRDSPVSTRRSGSGSERDGSRRSTITTKTRWKSSAPRREKVPKGNGWSPLQGGKRESGRDGGSEAQGMDDGWELCSERGLGCNRNGVKIQKPAAAFTWIQTIPKCTVMRTQLKVLDCLHEKLFAAWRKRYPFTEGFVFISSYQVLPMVIATTASINHASCDIQSVSFGVNRKPQIRYKQFVRATFGRRPLLHRRTIFLPMLRGVRLIPFGVFLQRLPFRRTALW